MVITSADLACLMAAPQKMMGRCCMLACSSLAFAKREILLQGQNPWLTEQLTAESAFADDSFLPMPEPHCSSHFEAVLQQPDAAQAAVVTLAGQLLHRDSAKFASARDGLQQNQEHHQHDAAVMRWLPELHACNHHHLLLLLQAAEKACLAELSNQTQEVESHLLRQLHAHNVDVQTQRLLLLDMVTARAMLLLGWQTVG